MGKGGEEGRCFMRSTRCQSYRLRTVATHNHAYLGVTGAGIITVWNERVLVVKVNYF